VAGLARRLGMEAHRHGQVRPGGQRELDRIAHVFRAGRNRYAGMAIETQGPQAGAVDVRSSRPRGQRDAGRIEHQRLRAEDIADAHPELRPAERDADDLAQRGIGHCAAGSASCWPGTICALPQVSTHWPPAGADGPPLEAQPASRMPSKPAPKID
jgi:hypothetical protein